MGVLHDRDGSWVVGGGMYVSMDSSAGASPWLIGVIKGFFESAKALISFRKHADRVKSEVRQERRT